ncbi:MAG: uracil-DNA glycosylase [Curvibacter sp.]|nr:uracil-DNA glycosylase [Curvibacter sp.]
MTKGRLFGTPVPPPDRLSAWAPQQWAVAQDWQPLVSAFFDSTEGRSLGLKLAARLAAGAVIYPPRPLHALELTPRAKVRVVILGQDPYHRPGQAEGLAFSVAPGLKLPPSMNNIFQELARDPALAPWTPPAHGSLRPWAEQGVLLLNTCLTVEDGLPASHSGFGWEVLTDSIVQSLVTSASGLVFMLWGAHAQKVAERAGLEAGGRHLVLSANHPSPLSARRPPQPFLGCGHFGQAQAYLRGHGKGVSW